MSLDLTSLARAISNLEDALEAYDDKAAQKNPNYEKFMLGASIHFFEYTYELTLKFMRRYFEMSSDSDVPADDLTFNDVIRAAYAKKIISSDLQTWRTYRKKRGITSHTYDDAKAQYVFAGLPNFLDEARYVLVRLRELSKPLD